VPPDYIYDTSACYNEHVPNAQERERLPDMIEYKDWNQKVKKTFNATSNEVVLTVTEAGLAIGLSKDHMKLYVDKHKLTKIPISRSVHRYLLLKSDIDHIVSTR